MAVYKNDIDERVVSIPAWHSDLARLRCFCTIGASLPMHGAGRPDGRRHVQHEGLGAKGGAQKQNYLQLKAAGDTWQEHGFATAPHYLGADGRVAVPDTWGAKMREAQQQNQQSLELQNQPPMPLCGQRTHPQQSHPPPT